MITTAYILGGSRTPIGKFLGGLANVPAPELGAAAIRAALERSAIQPEQVEEVVFGNVLSAGMGQAPARQAALAAGCPPTVAAVTVNKVCGSGLKAVMLAEQAVRLGDAECIVAGGVESMSRAPHLLTGVRAGWKFGHQQTLDSMLHDGLWCAHEDAAMGSLGDYIAEKCQVSRQDQDAFAAESHRRALGAAGSGAFDGEIVPVTIPAKGSIERTTIVRDEGPRPDSSVEALARLKPTFSPSGTVTPGNASQLSDGAAAVVVANERLAKNCRSPLKARIVASATSGVAPKDLFIAPVSAVDKVLTKARLTLAEIDLVELNEAFAAQCLACMRPLEMDHAKVNVNGGAIALGHPIGASGARVLVTLLHALAARNLRRGLAALCLGGGNAVAMVIERE
jgi:acetyl-CoA C-acetyltransferase